MARKFSRLSAREKFYRFVLLAAAEVSLVSTLLLLFLTYSFNRSLIVGASVLGILLVGSYLMRKSLQIAQIILILSAALGQLIVLLNYEPLNVFLFSDISVEMLGAAFLFFDIILFFLIIKTWGISD